MKKVSKLFAVLTAVTLLVGVMPAMAMASFPDVPSTHNAADAMGLLQDLEIYEGYPDGSAGPANPIRRDEFAAVVVRMLGKDTVAASAAAQPPAFSDAIPGWAWGYVNVATSLQIIQGYPDGSFGAAKSVTFAEAFAMLARALKVDKAAFGLWPFNYIMLGNTLGLDYGLTPSANQPITRGDMAIATKNALLSDVKWDKETEELYGPLDVDGDEGDFALLVTAHDYDAADIGDIQADLPGSVTGKITSVLGTSARIVLGGTEYKYTTVVGVGNVEFSCNKDALSAPTITQLTTLMTAERVVTASLNAAGKIWKVSWTQSRPYELITAATVTTGETAYGKVTITGVEVAIDPASVELWVNGVKSNVAALKTALTALQTTYGSGASASATVRTKGNAAIGTPANNVYYIDARTDKLVTGVVTSVGSDATGNYFRITVGTASQKHYYKLITPTVATDTVTFLVSPNDTVVAQLTVTIASSVFWARVLDVETIVGGKLYTVNTNAGSFLGVQNTGSPFAYDQTVITAAVAHDTVAAIRLTTTTGRVDLIGNTADVGFTMGSYAVGGSTLHFVTGAATVTPLGAMYAITQGGATVLATADALILDDDGTPSTKTLADLKITPALIGSVYYIELGGLRTAQIILLTPPVGTLAVSGADNLATKLVVTFNEALYKAGVAVGDGADVATSFTAAGTAVIGTAIYNAAAKTITFTFSTGAAGTDTVTHKTDTLKLTDAAGNAYPAKVYTFTTLWTSS